MAMKSRQRHTKYVLIEKQFLKSLEAEQNTTYPDKNDRYIVNDFGDEIYKFKIERVWFYEGKDKNRNGGEKIS